LTDRSGVTWASGSVATAAYGDVPHDVVEQLEIAIANLEAQLSAENDRADICSEPG
jgi:hypothetical protein